MQTANEAKKRDVLGACGKKTNSPFLLGRPFLSPAMPTQRLSVGDPEGRWYATSILALSTGLREQVRLFLNAKRELSSGQDFVKSHAESQDGKIEISTSK